MRTQQKREDEETDMKSTAQSGFAGGGGPLPYAEQIQQSFGRHDISHIKSYSGGAADEANDSMGSQAYASGQNVAFKGRPSLHTAAHEAAHIVQQKQGVSLKGGVGAEGDAYEKQADLAADAVVAGRSAEGILGQPVIGTRGDNSNAPIQHKFGKHRKKKGKRTNKKKVGRGNELTEFKSGSVEAQEDYKELLGSGNDVRVTELTRLLDGNNELGVRKLFDAVNVLLMGADPSLEAAYRVANQRSLRSDIGNVFGSNIRQYNYLLSILLNNGEPPLEQQLLLAMGYVTDVQIVDAKDVFFLFEEAKPQERVRVFHLIKTELKDSLGDKKFPRLESQVQNIETQKFIEDHQIDKTQHYTKQTLREAAENEILALVRTCAGELAMKRDKLAEVLPKWASGVEQDIRDYVTRPGGKFIAELKLQHKGVMGTVRQKLGLFTESDIEYIVETVKRAKPVGDWYFVDQDKREDLTDKEGEKRDKTAKEEGGKLGELTAYMERKERDKGKIGESITMRRWNTLIDKLDEMDLEMKEAYLCSLLDPQQQDRWKDSETPHGVRMHLRDEALRLLNLKLKAIGMAGHKATDVRHRIVDGFRVGATSITHHEMSTYQRIKNLARGADSPEKHGKKMLALFRKVRGEEFAMIRGDQALLDKIQRKVSDKYWKLIQNFLGITLNENTDRGEGDVDQDLFKSEGTDRKKTFENDEALEMGQDEAELLPSHWGILLGATLKESQLKRRTEVNSIVTRIYFAAKKREKLGKNDTKQSGDRTLKPMTAIEFMALVRLSMSSESTKIMSTGKKFKNAWDALVQCTRPSVDQQIEDAKFKNMAKRSGGTQLETSNATRLFEDMSGRELIDDWSNIEDFKHLYREWKRAHEMGMDRAADLKLELNAFILDVRPDRHAQLLELLVNNESDSRGPITKVLAKLRKQLAEAMRTDSEVVAYLKEVNFDNDELSQSRTETMGMLDEQKLRSTGKQYNHFLGRGDREWKLGPLTPKALIGSGTKSAQVKEGTGILIGRTRKAQKELDSGTDRDTVVDDNAKGIKEAQKELKRRGESFDSMQKKFNGFMMHIVKGLAAVIAAAAGAAIMVFAAPLGPAVVAAVLAGKVLIKKIIENIVAAKLKGDNFSTTAAVVKSGIAVFSTFAGGIVSGFGGGELLLSQGMTFLSEPTNEGQAALLSFAGKGLKQATKFALSTLGEQLTMTDTHPGARKMVMAHMGGMITAIGMNVSSAALTEFSQNLTDEDPGSKMGGEMVLSNVARGYALVAKKAKKLTKLIDLFEPERGEGGDSITGDLGGVVEAALERAKLKLGEMDQTGAFVWQEDEYNRLSDMHNTLGTDHEAFIESQKTNKGKDDDTDDLRRKNREIVYQAIALNMLLDELDEKEVLDV